MYLSKTIYVHTWACPKNAWLCRDRKDLLRMDENARARIRTGHEVGALAQGMFGPFVDVTVSREDGSPDLSAMMERTAAEMAAGTPVICEAAFSFGGLYCAVDVLRRDGSGWAIYEVKSSSDGEQAKYIADVSYQKYVLEHCGVKVTGVYLVCIDTSYVLEESGLDVSRFFKITDLGEQAAAEQAPQVSDVLRGEQRGLRCLSCPGVRQDRAVQGDDGEGETDIPDDPGRAPEGPRRGDGEAHSPPDQAVDDAGAVL